MIRTFCICRLALVLAIVFILQACSYIGLDRVFRDRSNDYRQAEDFPEMDVPDEMDTGMVGQLYPVPEGGEVVNYEIESEFEVPRPRSVTLNESANEVKIQRLGDDVWILMSVPPSEAWPRIRSYLTRTGIPTAKADISRGVIETGLFKLNEEPEKFQQFLISLSQGVQVNTTEVDIVHRSFPEDSLPDALPEWEETSVNLDYETWMRDSMSGDLAAGNIAGSASLLGQEIGAASKVELVTPEAGMPYIEMYMELDRAWASVGYALSRNGFSIVENQRSQGFYLADYQEPDEDKPSWWRRMLLLANTDTPKLSYRIDVTSQDGSVRVLVINDDGQEMSQRENFLVLQRIRNSLG